MILGEYNAKKFGRKVEYFLDRHIYLDCRGCLEIDPTAQFGFRVMILTTSHIPDWLIQGMTPETTVTRRKVVIEKNVWVTSGCIIYNSWLSEGCVIGVGSVVSSVHVPAFAMVTGNPAKMIGKYNHITKEWMYLKDPIELQRVQWSHNEYA
jgi:acetyltransferase-like isoleucine patch superfamily enzyme